MELDQEILNDFLAETSEGLEIIANSLIELEKNTDNSEVIDGLFRCLHSIKGVAGFFGFQKLEHITHVAENLLDLARKNHNVITPMVITCLLSVSDQMTVLVGQIADGGKEGDLDIRNTIVELEALCELAEGMDNPPSESVKADNAADTPSAINHLEDVGADDALEMVADIVVEPTPEPEETVAAKPEDEVEEVTAKTNSKEAAGKLSDISDQTIRVDVNLLDNLMDLVGELVLARNQLLAFNQQFSDRMFNQISQGLNLVTSELQEKVMQVRMQPIGNLWNKYPRIVRELATTCQKKVELVLDGKNTFLDKSVIEAIKDPLTHMVRNAVDHGIEGVEERKAAGKPEVGTLTLSAGQENGQVLLRIIDDGKGIDIEKVKAKAISAQIITAAQAERMSASEANLLILHPGLSTADKVSNISGRGVGMDVVKSNIESIGGVIDIQSEIGVGTEVIVKIPLTLAIIPALIVTNANVKFAIPQTNILELAKINTAEIEYIQNIALYRLRGNLLPLISLSEILGLPSQIKRPAGKSTVDESSILSDELKIVILQVNETQVGLILDEIRDTQEIVVKQLSKHIGDITIYAGVTVLGDGDIALILDVMGLASYAGIESKHDYEVMSENVNDTAKAKSAMRYLLLVEGGLKNRLALPLDAISRLEDISCRNVERVGERTVVQYNGHIMSLIYIDDLISYLNDKFINSENMNRCLKAQDGDVDKMLKVVVYHDAELNQPVGLIVDSVIDTVYEEIREMCTVNRAGISATFVLQERTTELIDPTVLNKGLEGFYASLSY